MKNIIHRKIIFLLLSTVCSLTVTAQTEISIEEYTAQVKTRLNSITEGFEKKDGTKIVKLYSELIVFFDKLSKDEQETNLLTQSYNYYNLACGYSLQNQKKKAIDAFEKAIKTYGFANYKQVKNDTDFDNIRADKRFIVLIEGMREKSDYVYILRQAEKYQNSDTAVLPRFVYEEATSYT